MITIDKTPKQKHGGKYRFKFFGLSTDTKPTETYDNMAIANGSTFMEMDTKTLSYYDESANDWV